MDDDKDQNQPGQGGDQDPGMAPQGTPDEEEKRQEDTAPGTDTPGGGPGGDEPGGAPGADDTSGDQDNPGTPA